jgi:phosphodiesterase/alkaline phosphatase D-like protein
MRLRISPWGGIDCPVEIHPYPSSPHSQFSIENMERTDGESTWIVDIANLSPGTTYHVGITPPLGIASQKAIVRTLPTSLTEVPLEIGLFSCYFPSEEYCNNAVRARSILETLDVVPHLKFFAGDQIYGDVPSSSNSIKTIYRDRHREIFEDDRLGSLLSYGANLFTCDDHEYWNSYPESAWWLSRTYDRNWMEARQEATAHFYQNQGILNFSTGFTGGAADNRCWCSGTLSGIDLFVTDTRTDRASRDNERQSSNKAVVPPSTMSLRQLGSLRRWIDHVERVGLLVLGQPLWLLSESYDNALCDYGEFDTILDDLARNMRDRDVTYIVLTGDIHWGRLTILKNLLRPASKLIEFVSSPIARVGMRSILSRRLDVGKRPNVNFKFDDQPRLKHYFGTYDKEKVFATNENNFGRLSLFSPTPASLEARIELWSLDTQSLALNRWNGLDQRCQRALNV